MSSQILAVIAVVLAFRGSYLAKKASSDEEKDYARFVSLSALLLTSFALLLR